MYFAAVYFDSCNQILLRRIDEAISTPWKNVMTNGIKVGKYMMKEITLRTVKLKLDGVQSNSQNSL